MSYEFDNTYGVIPCLHVDTHKEVYMVLLFDGFSFPECGVYSKREDAERVAEMLNERKEQQHDQNT